MESFIEFIWCLEFLVGLLLGSALGLVLSGMLIAAKDVDDAAAPVTDEAPGEVPRIDFADFFNRAQR